MTDTTTKFDRTFDLKCADGKVVQWTGKSGEDAARRYVDCKGGTIVASREHDDGIHVLGRAGHIIG